MTAATTDLFQKVGQGTVTTLDAPGKAQGDSTISVVSASNFPSDTGFVVAIRTVDNNGVLVAGTYTEWLAVKSSPTTMTINPTPVYGADQAYQAGTSTQVFIPLSSASHNKLIDGLLVEHAQDGTHTVDTLSEKTSGNGVVVDGVGHKDGLIVGGAGTGVANSSLSTTAGDLGGAWTAWTPTLANIAQGSDGTVSAHYTQVGKTVHFRLIITLGATGSSVGSGPTFTLPVTPSSNYVYSGTSFGVARYKDGSASSGIGFCDISSDNIARLIINKADSTYVTISLLSATIPHTWAATDTIHVTGTYEAA